MRLFLYSVLVFYTESWCFFKAVRFALKERCLMTANKIKFPTFMKINEKKEPVFKVCEHLSVNVH